MVGYTPEMLYSQACSHSRRRWLWSLVTGRSRRLLSLAEVRAGSTLTRHDAGVRTVPIERIRGSESRSADFDCDFNPLKSHSEKRWLRVARAWQEGKPLPPIKLIQVGDIYFVRDGHHRVSVARTLGVRSIEAEVTVWR